MAEVPEGPARVVVSVEDLRTVLQSQMPLRFRHGSRPYMGAYERLVRALNGEDALAGAGLVVTGVCVCGQPLGTCPCCGDSRCWRCDPESDGCRSDGEHAHRRMLTSMPSEHLAVRDEELERLRARAEAARRMLDGVREELHQERVEHGAVVAVLARVRAVAKEWAALGDDVVEPADEVLSQAGKDLLEIVGNDNKTVPELGE